jgi:NAD(P)-dependent dehydrogenase (short-subunit alcohol dehydrogenase family)
MKKLTDKVAVITGGTSGIGLAAAKLFREEGARVVIMARGEEGLRQALGTLGSDAHGVRGDVTKPGDLARLFAETQARYGKVDVLFANAAVVKLAAIADCADSLFDEVMATNVKGTFSTLRAAIPQLATGASVIVTTSWLNRIGFAGSGAVAMSKAAVRSLVRVAATELAPRRIRVNALCPGAIETPLWGKLGLPDEALKAAGAGITNQIPLGRWGKPREIAQAALFLACQDSAYMNGAELQVDGGMRQA